MTDVIEFDTVEEKPQIAVEPEIRKRRGRPPKNTDTTKEGEEKPSTAGTHKPKRRKKGPATVDELNDRARAIAAMHMTVAFVTQTPELILNEQECLALAQANLNIENEFDIQLDGKTMAIITMVGTMFGVYRPRIPIIFEKMKEAKRKKDAEKAMGIDASADN